MEHSHAPKPRLNIRCTPEQMAVIREAADHEIRSVSSFVLAATLEHARQVVKEPRHADAG